VKLGIDFGTTRTVVACVDRGNYPVVSFFDAAGDAHDFFPSVVAEKNGELRFGFDALACATDASANADADADADAIVNANANGWTIVRSFKRLLGGPRATPDDAVRIGSTELPVRELIVQFLAATKTAIAERSNQTKAWKRSGESSLRSVVAVPANASGLARFATLDAFRRAGLAPVAMLNEPSAAGFEYTHRHRDTLTQKREHVVVYDLGGGTFDASLVRMRGKSHDVLATGGKTQLGGDDFDDVLVGLVLDAAKIARKDVSAASLEHLRIACRDAKESLNPSSKKIAIDLPEELGGTEIVVPVAAFYDAATPLVEESIDAMSEVMATPEDLAGIYVVGGASELPIVARLLRDRFGRRVHRSPYPSAAIAIGLAIACDEDAGFELSDRFSRTFGVFREGRGGAEITFDPIFTRDTVVPPPGAERVRFVRSYRAAHNVGHFRFVECAHVDGGRPRGDLAYTGDVLFPFDASLRAPDTDLAGVQVERLAGGGPRIEEEYTLDEHGLVAVTIRDLDSGVAREHTLGRR
jgi:molecular chaperone DnaK (HSP70)